MRLLNGSVNDKCGISIDCDVFGGWWGWGWDVGGVVGPTEGTKPRPADLLLVPPAPRWAEFHVCLALGTDYTILRREYWNNSSNITRLAA